MREQKKDHSPAKGNSLIGNRLHGNSNLGNLEAQNKDKERRILAEMIPTLRDGYSTFLRVCRAIESKFEEVQDGNK